MKIMLLVLSIGKSQRHAAGWPVRFLAVLGLGLLGAAAMAGAQTDITGLRGGQLSAEYNDSPAGEGITNVIDNASSTKYLTFHATAWIQFQTTTPYAVSAYTITSANDHPERDPTNWTLAGSSDGATWSTVDTRTNQAFANRFQKNSYTIAAPTPYAYYRLTMTCDSGTTLQLAEWELLLTVAHDVSATSVSVSYVSSDSTIAPQVSVSNFGAGAESFPVTCRVDSAGKTVAANTLTVTNLAGNAAQTLTFPAVAVAQNVLYHVTAWTTLSNDGLPANDTASTSLYTGEYAVGKDSVVYAIAYAHLDDQWNWTLGSTISSFLPNTMTQNFAYFDQYPEYNFSFEGAFRYWLIKRYYPANYATLKSWIAQNRWNYVGTFWDGCDVNIPSAEALIRQALYGNEFSMDEFNKRSLDVFLPDCFGFGYALPTIAHHCGLIGFSTQKFDQWGGWFPTPFSIGRWIGPDGSSVIASLKPGPYNNGLDIRTADGNALMASSGIWATQDYVGTGDQGGAPAAGDVSTMIAAIRANATTSIKVVCAPPDKLYRDLTPSMVAALPSYDGELELTTHGSGSFTSWATMKLKDRRNEQRAAAAEFACVTANWLTGGTFAYPMDTLVAGWHQVLASQFHDVLPGTAISGAYDIAQPMEDSAYADFNYALGLGNDAMANGAGQQLTTNVSVAARIPLVLVNPLAIARNDAIKAVVTFGAAAHGGVKVFDPAGAEVPAQIVGSSGQYDTIVFAAKVPSASYSVFEAEAEAVANPPSAGLTIKTSATDDTLENSFYRVIVNVNGDISSVFDKHSGHELFALPSRLELRADPGTGYPAWEVSYAAVSAAPTGYVDQTVVRTVKETGPARVALQVARTKGSSSFTQIIELASDSAGARVDIENAINWMETNTLLKVGFPTTCTNDSATWDLGIGVIKRPTMNTARYEVMGHEWADLTNAGNGYGLSILNNCKYGWNKESTSKLNLTLIHSPTPSGNYPQDLSNVNWVGIHQFTYSLYGHSGTWTNGTVQQAACLNQPVYAFQSAPRTGALSAKTLSLVTANSPQVMVMAIKKAEKSNYYVVRVRESSGAPITGARLTFGAAITRATEMNGVEDTIASASPMTVSGSDLTFNLTKFQPRTFAVTLVGSPAVSAGYGRNLPAQKMAGTAVTVSLVAAAGKSRANFVVPFGEKIESIAIVDAAGKIVRTLVKKGRSGEAHSFVWDGTSDQARGVGAGVYFVYLSTDRSRMSSRLMKAR